MNATSPGDPVDLAEPRFDLRFQAGRGRLVLRRPVQAFPARVEALVLAVDLPKRFDLGRGIERLRHMRARVEEAAVEVRWRSLVQLAASVGVELSLRGLRGSRLALATRDEAGVLAAELDVLGDGADVVFGLRLLEWVREAPRPALERLVRRLSPLGLRWESTNGVFRLRRPLRGVLAETLLPSGHRLPEERQLGLTLELRRRGVVLNTSAESHPADLDRYRRQLAEPPAWLAAAMDGDPSPTAKLDPSEIRPPWLRGDAVRARLEEDLPGRREPLGTETVDALLDALWLHPMDGALWSEWANRLADRRDPAILRVVRALLDQSHREREPLVLEALTLAARAGVSASELQPLLAEAEHVAPGSPHVGAMRAEATPDRAEAAELWVRAADAVDDDTLASRWLRSAAEALRDLRGARAALGLAERAADRLPADVHAAVLLADLLAEVGDPEALSAAYARLLEVDPRDDDAEEVWERGLARAASHHVQQGREDRARPFLAALDDRSSVAPPPEAVAGFDEVDLDAVESLAPESGEIELDAPEDGLSGIHEDAGAGDDDGDWPKSEIWEAPPKDLADDEEVFDDEWSASEVWDAEPRLADRRGEDAEPAPEAEAPISGTHMAPPDEEPVQMTQVGVADEDMRELLEDVRGSSDPGGLLEGALEGALDNGDEDAVRRVLMVLDRLGTITENDVLRTRALEWLASLE